MKNETKQKAIDCGKTAVSYLVGAGTGVVTKTICAPYTPPTTAGMMTRVLFGAGQYGLSTLTAAAAKRHTRHELNKLEKGIKKTLATRKVSKGTVEMEVVD